MYDSFNTFMLDLKFRGWTIFLPKPYWDAHKGGLLPYWGIVQGRGDGHRRDTNWQVRKFVTERLGISVEPEPILSAEETSLRKERWYSIANADSIKLPEPTFQREKEWEKMLETYGLKKALGRMSFLFSYEGQLYEIMCVRITLGFHSKSEWEQKERMRALRRTYGITIQNVRADNVKGYIIVCKRRYEAEELTRTRRRIEDRLRKDDKEMIRVAKFLGLK